MISTHALYCFDLASRRWQSEHVRLYTLSLARLRQPAVQTLLDAMEPLHEVREWDEAGVALWRMYCRECVGLAEVVRT